MCGEIGECVQSGVAVWDASVGCVAVRCAEGDVAEDCVKGEEGCVSVGCVNGDVTEDKGVDCVGIKGIRKGGGGECMPETCDVLVDKARDEINSCSLKCTCLEIQIWEVTGS